MLQKPTFSARKIATLGILTAAGLIAFLIENAFPPLLGIPGAKMGLANIFSLIALILYSPLEGFIVIIARTLLGALFQANFSAILFSFTGGIVSMALSAILLYAVYPKVSILAVSIAAAVLHNLTQNAVYVLETGVVANFTLAPYFALVGILSGAIVGGVCLTLFRALPKRFLLHLGNG